MSLILDVDPMPGKGDSLSSEITEVTHHAKRHRKSFPVILSSAGAKVSCKHQLKRGMSYQIRLVHHGSPCSEYIQFVVPEVGEDFVEPNSEHDSEEEIVGFHQWLVESWARVDKPLVLLGCLCLFLAIAGSSLFPPLIGTCLLAGLSALSVHKPPKVRATAALGQLPQFQRRMLQTRAHLVSPIWSLNQVQHYAAKTGEFAVGAIVALVLMENPAGAQTATLMGFYAALTFALFFLLIHPVPMSIKA